MSDQIPPSFEDLEPEGEPYIDDGHHSSDIHRLSDHRDHPEDFVDFDADDFDKSFSDPDLDPEYQAHAEFFDLGSAADDEHQQLPGHTTENLMKETNPTSDASLPSYAARIAFNQGARAGSGTGHFGNGRKPRKSPLQPQPEQICGAAFLETHELILAIAVIASRAADESEAAALAATVVPLTINLEVEASRALWPTIPVLVRGTTGVVRYLHRHPSTRSYIKWIPEILLTTIEHLADHILSGRKVSKRLTARVLAQTTKAVLAERLKSRRSGHSSQSPGSPDYNEV